MHLLIVDDEPYAIEYVKQSLQWQDYGITQVFTAYSMKQAQQVLLQNTVEILITDIEMPKGNGLELVGWIREQKQQIVCIFLTSHANFQYAYQAIHLEGLTYLLKPVAQSDLEKAIGDAVVAVTQAKEHDKTMEQVEQWARNRNRILEQFWKDIIAGAIPHTPESIHRKAEQLRLSIALGRYLPILICTCANEDFVQKWGQDMYDYACTNVIGELLQLDDEQLPVLANRKSEYIVLYRYAAHYAAPEAFIKEGCRQIVKLFEKHGLGKVQCFVGHGGLPHELHGRMQDVLRQRRNHVSGKTGVFTDESPQEPIAYLAPVSAARKKSGVKRPD